MFWYFYKFSDIFVYSPSAVVITTYAFKIETIRLMYNSRAGGSRLFL